MEIELFKLRSIGGCVKAATNLLITNLKTIIRRTWLPALLIAILGGGLFLTAINFTPLQGDAAVYGKLALIVALVLIIYVAYAWQYTIVASLLNGASVRSNIPRIARLAWVMLVAAAIVANIVAFAGLIPFLGIKDAGSIDKATMLSQAIVFTVVIVAFLALLPLCYSAMKYTMETEIRIMDIFKRLYVIGVRHYGYLFMLLLIAGIITTIIDVIVSLPWSITIVASQFNTYGMTIGDATGLPSYFPVLAFIAASVSFFIKAYLNVWLVMVAYYGYGHIEAKERLKADLKPVKESITIKEK